MDGAGSGDSIVWITQPGREARSVHLGPAEVAWRWPEIESAPARDTVREFYKQNHLGQTLAFVNQKRDTYLQLNHRRMSVFEALDYLNTLVDESDPDIELDQLQHLLQAKVKAVRKSTKQFVVCATVEA